MNAVEIQLGRAGDIINILPAIPLLEKKYGRITLMVSRDYSSLLDGISYCNVDVFQDRFENINQAVAIARQRYDKVLVSSVYGHGWNVPHGTPSFCIESWKMIGLEHEFGKHPLIFDRRSPEREQALISQFPQDKPWILYCGTGHSSPFKHADLLEQGLARFSDRFHIINIGKIRAERFYDILGLMDRAACLVTIDSGPLHLARASRVPVVALVTDIPTLWHGATCPPNTVFKCRYGEFVGQAAALFHAIDKVARNAIPIARKPILGCPRLVHVYSDYPATGETYRREMFARRTWESEYRTGAWVHAPVFDKDLRRSSRDIGDKRGVPFIKDLVQKGMELAQDDDVIVLSNSDTCFCTGLTEAILAEVSVHGALSAHRYDFHHQLLEIYTPTQAMAGNFYVGADLFAFTKIWWAENKSDFPDLLLGYEGWDLCLRTLILRSGGSVWYYPMIYHEHHESFWSLPSVKNKHPAQLHNIRLVQHFLKRLGIPLNEFSRI